MEGQDKNQLQPIGLALGSLAVASSIAALALFPQQEQATRAWRLYLVSAILFMAACYTLFPGRRRGMVPDGRARGHTPVVIGWMALILGLALFMRLYRLDALPFGTWYDEADNGQYAMQILQEPNYRPTYAQSTNLPAHFLYLIALAFRWFGAGSTFAIRTVTAAFGLGTVLAAFFLGRQARGERFGLILAFFFAVARWHVTFSRLGLHGISTPFFIVLAMLFLLRAKRTGRTADFGWAGLTFGLGLCFYTAYRLFVVVLLLFLLYWGFDWWRSGAKKPGHGTRFVFNLLALALAAGLVIAPVAQFALHEPDTFWNRFRQVSIFTRRDEADLGKAVWESTVKHLLAFNYQGDGNGRHNLPREPMLDPVMGVLFVLGLGLALSRPRAWPELLFLLLFPAGLGGGILSLDFEAPQMLRSIASMPAVFYFAALAAEALWRGLERSGRDHPAGRGAYLALAVGLGGLIFYTNAYTYFVRWANNDDVWRAHNAVETLTARHMLEMGPAETSFYVSPFFNNHKVIQFLAPEVRQTRALLVPDTFPIREPGDKPVVLFIDRDNEWMVDQALNYYPRAQYQMERTPSGRPALYLLGISPAELQQIQGLNARYWHGKLAAGEPVLARVEKGLAVHWPAEAALALPFVAEWSGVLYAPQFGDYELQLLAPATATLWLDEELLLTGVGGERRTTLSLAQGNHALRVQATGGEGKVQLAWRTPRSEGELETVPLWALYLSPPVSNHGLRGVFYNGPDWRGLPALERVDPRIDMYFHVIPLPRPYSVEWAGQIDIPTGGEYAFGLQVRGQAQLFVDGRKVIEALEPAGYVEGKMSLDAGRYPLRLRYLDHLGNSRLYLYWTPPGGEREVVPSDVLWPYP